MTDMEINYINAYHHAYKTEYKRNSDEGATASTSSDFAHRAGLRAVADEACMAMRPVWTQQSKTMEAYKEATKKLVALERKTIRFETALNWIASVYEKNQDTATATYLASVAYDMRCEARTALEDPLLARQR